LRLRPFLSLFRARQRMQLGLSDSNMAETAEYLKVATTALVLEMAVAGRLTRAPRPARPVDALHALVADPTLTVRVPILGREPMSALELQRYYLGEARAWLREVPAPSLEAHRVVSLWAEVLDALEEDPGQLVGSIDWVSKRYLIEGCADGERASVAKKIDL